MVGYVCFEVEGNHVHLAGAYDLKKGCTAGNIIFDYCKTVKLAFCWGVAIPTIFTINDIQSSQNESFWEKRAESCKEI